MKQPSLLRNKIEILAPVGGREQLEAAVRCGADAVYLGASTFNARRNAENFSRQGLQDAVRYCHARGTAVHVTLNTLFLDTEREQILDAIEEIAFSGADAVIVQDLGTAALVKKCCPQIALHASTQLSVHNLEGVREMERLGFQRVVLAREVSAQEIRKIRAGTEMELEIFVHGAHCVSMSGQCYLSCMLGERSGNRGLCAQPCRLEFRSDKRDYALSLKDLSIISHMEEIRELGIQSLKIEGRMKRPEYVAAAVTACRQALAGQQPDMDSLQAVFSRSGFSDGYFEGKRDGKMFGYRTKEDVAASAGVLGSLAGLYRGEMPRIPVDMAFTAEENIPVRLAVTDGTSSVSAEGEVPQTALNRPTDEALARRNLEKTGGTPFYLENLQTQIGDGLMVPASSINKLRKDCLEQLLALREHPSPLPFFRENAGMVENRHPVPSGKPKLWLQFHSIHQFCPDFSADKYLFPIEELVSHPDFCRQTERIAAVLPLAEFGTMERSRSQLQALKELGIREILAGGPAAVALGREMGMTILGDYSLNILNSDSLTEAEKMGVSAQVLSFELNLKAARRLSGTIPRGAIGYGSLPVMTFRSCPLRGPKGCGDCRRGGSITDRLGNRFPILCHRQEYSQLLNMVPLYLGDKQDSLLGLNFVLLRFTTEAPEECAEILHLWNNGGKFPGKRTGGLAFRDLK